MCRVRTKSKREASSQNLTLKTSHMLNISYNFLNGFELISKMTRGPSHSAEIRWSVEKSHVCPLHTLTSPATATLTRWGWKAIQLMVPIRWPRNPSWYLMVLSVSPLSLYTLIDWPTIPLHTQPRQQQSPTGKKSHHCLPVQNNCPCVQQTGPLFFNSTIKETKIQWLVHCAIQQQVMWYSNKKPWQNATISNSEQILK